MTNLGVLGEESEPFLAKALELITGSTARTTNTKSKTGIGMDITKIVSSKDFAPIGRNMYIENPFK